MATRTHASTSVPQQSDMLVSPVVMRSPLPAEPELQSEASPSGLESDHSSQDSAFKENFSRVPVRPSFKPSLPSQWVVQPKLVVGQPNDKYEQEADRVADQVMQMSEPVSSPLQTQPPNIQHYRPQFRQPLQRQVAGAESMAAEPEEEEEEKAIQTKTVGAPSIQHYLNEPVGKLQRQSVEEEDDDEEETPVQAKAMVSGPKFHHFLSGPEANLQRQSAEEEDDDEEETPVQAKANHSVQTALPSIETQLNRSQGFGQPLPEPTRDFMESRFNHDFSQVRVHTDSTAAQMNRGLNAQAFTHGQNIYFGQGQYRPQTASGKHLLAHELTHTIQQKPAIIKRFPRPTAPPPILSQRQAANAQDSDATEQPTAQPAPIAPKPVTVGAHAAQPQIALRQDAAPGAAAPVFSSETRFPPASPTGVNDSPSLTDRATVPESEATLLAETTTDTNQASSATTSSQSTEEISVSAETATDQADGSVPVATEEQPTALEQEPEAAVADGTAAGGQEAEAATVEPLALAGSSDQAMVAFTEASPSQIAATQPSLGAVLDSKIQQEQQTEAANAPVLVAKTSGILEAGVTPPEPISSSGEAQIEDGVTEVDPGALEAEPHENVGTVPSNQANEKLLDRQDDDSFLSWFRNNTESFLSRIHTRSDVNTSAGERPDVKLEGEADPNRMTNQRGEAESQLKTQRDATADAFKQHPGQQNIQPRAVNEEKPTQISTDVAVSIETASDSGAIDYANAPMSPEVRAHADELLKPSLEANLAVAKAQTQDAANTKDRDKAAAISQAETDAAAVNQKADNDQRDIVLTNRQAVAKQQQEGIQGAYDEVNEFITEADKEQTANRKEISDQVKEKEGEARKELEKGEEKAEAEKQAKEKEAADKKKELEREQENDSWWDRAVSAIKSAVKAITSAIDTIFTKLREAVKTIIEKAKEAAIGLINKARDWVIDKLNKFRDWAKDKVNTYLKDRFPGLAKRINEGIDGFVDTAIKGVNVVADAAIAGVEAVANGLTAALDKVLQVFQTALKAAVQIAGAVITGDFAEALRIAVQAACDIAGIDSKPIFDFIDRAASKVTAILKDPKTFFNNVMKAIGGGVSNFATNVQQHLVKGLIGWLTGALSEVSLSLPATFDSPGILSLVMQILGLTYENIKAKVIKRFPPAATVIEGVEKGITIVQRLVTEGPMALWEEVQQKMSNLKDLVISGIKDFVAKTVVKEGIVWLLGLLTPVGAIAKLLKLIFDFVMFLVERFQQIKDFVMSVYDSITAIASGNLSQAMKAVEDALSRSLPVVISLLASLAGLGGIGKTVKNIIGKVAKPVNKIVDSLIDRMVKFAKKLLKKGKAAVSAVFKFFGVKTQFKTDTGESHAIYYQETAGETTLMVASNPRSIQDFLEFYVTEYEIKPGSEKGKIAQGIKSFVKKEIIPLNSRLKRAKNKKPIQQELLNKNVELSQKLKLLLSGDRRVGKIIDSYMLEGLTGTYSSIPKPTADILTPDHQPQAAILEWAAAQSYFGKNSNMAKRAQGRANAGYAINLHELRHQLGRTYGSKGDKTKKDFIDTINNKLKGKRKAQEKRDIVVSMIKAELKKDVKSMKDVVSKKTSWSDIEELNVAKPGKQKLISTIKKNIISGENQLLVQDLESLKN